MDGQDEKDNARAQPDSGGQKHKNR